MYYDYFGLKQPPFKITPDTRLFFPGGDRGAVLQALIYAITQGEGIVKVIGEVGAGKTMLSRMLEVELPENVEIVYLANPSLSPENILHAIAFELKLNVTETDTRLKVINELQNYLLDRHADNQQIVVFVEEAQGMPVATLEEIRLLSNLETTQDKLLQIVLFGQPELDEKISTREIRQLKERITYSFQLTPFKAHDVKDYLNSRLRTCGYRSADVFSPSAVTSITKHSKGLLRRINILADKSLLAAYAGNTHKVTPSHVKIAARDSEFIVNRTFLTPTMISMVSIILVILIGGLVFPEKINQGIHVIQGSLGTYSKTTNVQATEEPTITENQASTELVSESLSTEHLNQDVLMENSTQEAQFDTMYLPQHDASRIVDEASSLVAGLEGRQLLELSALDQDKLNQGYGPGSLTTNDELYEKVNSAEITKFLEKEDVSLSMAEPIGMGLTEQEFERFKQQLVAIPPEVMLEMGSEERCEKCSSLIYRPKL
jgi:type II secretory pathway predicted ATPase ExeA